jgi:hypothetical protein
MQRDIPQITFFFFFFLCFCVCERERERESVCVRERERERERDCKLFVNKKKPISIVSNCQNHNLTCYFFTSLLTIIHKY